MVSDRKAKESFKVITGPNGGYHMICRICPEISKGWDWRRNALAKGYAHSFMAHSIDSVRGQHAASFFLFQP